MGKQWNQWQTIFWGSKITADGDCSQEIKRHLLLERKVITNLDTIKKQKHCFTTKGLSIQGYGFPSSHVWMWELDYKESWAVKNWCFWTVVLENTLENPLDLYNKEILGDSTSQSWRKSVLNIQWCWSCNSNTLATWCEEPTHWKRLWCWERLKAEGERDDRRWDG